VVATNGAEVTTSADRVYPGARPFERGESGRFFGRKDEAADLGQHWLENPVTYLYGPAGIGKTSLLTAGVLPEVESRNVSLLPVGSLSHGARLPVAALGAHNPYTLALLRSWSDTDNAKLAGLTVIDFVRRYARRRAQSVLIMAAIDQTDDLFAGPESREEHRRYFLYQLEEALREPNLRLLVSIREDSLAEVAGAIGDGKRFRLNPLGIAAAEEAAKGPGEFDSRAASELINRIRTSHIASTGGHERLFFSDDVEPALLQIACAWLRDSVPADSSPITMREIRKHGNVDAALSSYCSAMIATVAEAHDIQVERLHLWLINTFITVGGYHSATPERLTGIGGQPKSVARAFEDRYMLRAHVDPPFGSRSYQLISERLIEPLRHAAHDEAAPEEDPVAYLKAAERALNTGELVLAEWYASRVLSIAPDTALRWHAEARSLLGNLAYERRQFEQAEEEYWAAATLFEAMSDKIAVVRLLAAISRTLFDRGLTSRALEQLTAAQRRATPDATVQLELSWVVEEATRRLSDGPSLDIASD
jgi:hypothetical protein